MHLKDVAVLVTGGASGLGEATVRLMIQKGAKVAVVDRDETRGRALREETGCHYIQTNVADDEAVKRTVDKAEELIGIPRIVVNCAGVGSAGGLLTFEGAEQYEKFDRIMKVNLYGTFSVMRHVLRRMTTLEPLELGERGVIVNTASISGIEGQAEQTIYAASKAAIIGLTLPAARDLGPWGIRVCAIAPGLFDTPMLGTSTTPFDSLEREIPFPRMRGRPAAFAALVEHICVNPFLNGEVIRLDGALRVPPYRNPPGH